jgi:hypothetical protein
MTNEIPFEESELVEDREDVQMFVKAEILSAKFGLVQGERVRNASDDQVRKALTLFPQARDLALLADEPGESLEP